MPPEAHPLLEARDLYKSFDGAGKDRVHAVNGVSFSVQVGQAVSIIGESGSGKSTIARLLSRLTIPTSGAILFDGQDIADQPERIFRKRRRDLQIVFQDPFSTLNPRHSIGRLIEEPLKLHMALRRPARAARVRALMDQVRLPQSFIDRMPSQLSGGQLQRVSIARAIATDPRLVILDEPTSSLDVSIRRGIIDLLDELRRERGMAMVMITHDLATARRFSDRILVVYFGRIIEAGPAAAVLNQPLHPYTQFLLSAELAPDPAVLRHYRPVSGEMPSPLRPPPGCAFAPRCPMAMPACTTQALQAVPAGPRHGASCLLLA